MTESMNTSAMERLKQFVSAIETLEEEKSGVAEDIKAKYSEAKGEGYDTKALKAVIRLRKLSKAEREEQEAILDLYLNAIEEA